MSHRNAIALALALPLFASALVACGDMQTLDEDRLRAVNVKDTWGIHGTTHFPDVNSCADYYNDLCAGLNSSMCTIATNRYSCTEASQGVLVTDTYGVFVATQAERSWEGVSLGDESGSGPFASPGKACGGMEAIEKQSCGQLAGLAGHLAEHHGKILDAYPAGGFAQLIVIDDHLLLTAPEGGGEDLVWQTASEMEWTVPMVEGELLLPNAGYVFEDDVILAIRPNGTFSLSSPQAAFSQVLPSAELVELEQLGEGECIELGEELEAVGAGSWAMGEGVPENIVIQDDLMKLDWVYEDNIMLRFAGPGATLGASFNLPAVTVLVDSPEVANNCDGFCDGLCLDGECYMNLPPYSLSEAGLCASA